MRGLGRFLLPIAWMGVIAALSSDYFASSQTESWLGPLLRALLPGGDPALFSGLHTAVRKLAHVVAYGILAGLWLGTLRPGCPPRRAAVWAVALAAAYAVVDELRQGLTTQRSAASLDVLIDACGAVLAVTALQASGSVAMTLCRLARWTALLLAATSLAAAAVDWQLGVPAWDLILAALGATLVAWGFRRIERRPRDPGLT